MNLASTTPRFFGGLSLDTKQLEILTEPRGWTDQRGVLLEGVVVENLNHPITMRALHDFLHMMTLSKHCHNFCQTSKCTIGVCHKKYMRYIFPIPRLRVRHCVIASHGK